MVKSTKHNEPAPIGLVENMSDGEKIFNKWLATATNPECYSLSNSYPMIAVDFIQEGLVKKMISQDLDEFEDDH